MCAACRTVGRETGRGLKSSFKAFSVLTGTYTSSHLLTVVLWLVSISGIGLTWYGLGLVQAFVKKKKKVSVVFSFCVHEVWQEVSPSSRKQPNHWHNAWMKVTSWIKGLTLKRIWWVLVLILAQPHFHLDLILTQHP